MSMWKKIFRPAKSGRKPTLDEYDSGECDGPDEVQIQHRLVRETCTQCDGQGSWYGMAPHKHDLSRGTFIGSTRIEPKEVWPKNFHEDPECEGCGIWTCPTCDGSGFVEMERAVTVRVPRQF